MDNQQNFDTEVYSPSEYSPESQPSAESEIYSGDAELFVARENETDDFGGEFSDFPTGEIAEVRDDKKPTGMRSNPSVNAMAATVAIAALVMMGAAAYTISQESALPSESDSSSSVQEVSALPVPAPTPDPAPEPSETSSEPIVNLSFDVVFSLGGGRVGNSIQDVFTTVGLGESAAAPTPVRDGYIFEGWTTTPDGNIPAKLDGVNESFTAYAKWRKGGENIAEQSGIKAVFKYRWSADEFHPFADIAWSVETEPSYIFWQVYDQNGAPTDSRGRIDLTAGESELAGYEFGVSAPISNGLYPRGYTLRLTPYVATEAGETAGSYVSMELPYFEAEAESMQGELLPVIYTNVGFYFEHSYDRLTITEEGNRLRIKGSLVAIEGERRSLEIDVLTS